jgi:uracil DNA glycosylase
MEVNREERTISYGKDVFHFDSCGAVLKRELYRDRVFPTTRDVFDFFAETDIPQYLLEAVLMGQYNYDYEDVEMTARIDRHNRLYRKGVA